MSTPFALKAQENLSAGLDLLASGKLNAAANRLYYACFQAAVHTLETKHGKTPDKLVAGATYWKHAMVRNLMNLVSGDTKHKVLYKAMQDLREEADYKSTMVAKSMLDRWHQRVADFVGELTK